MKKFMFLMCMVSVMFMAQAVAMPVSPELRQAVESKVGTYRLVRELESENTYQGSLTCLKEVYFHAEFKTSETKTFLDSRIVTPFSGMTIEESIAKGRDRDECGTSVVYGISKSGELYIKKKWSTGVHYERGDGYSGMLLGNSKNRAKIEFSSDGQELTTTEEQSHWGLGEYGCTIGENLLYKAHSRLKCVYRKD